ncbi:MAG: fibronectin type III domain-containing protein, partial [Acidobacteria bacterium]|nr:fibronectin type III domain-containing protein [Acidobacteriota bacterium]
MDRVRCGGRPSGSLVAGMLALALVLIPAAAAEAQNLLDFSPRAVGAARSSAAEAAAGVAQGVRAGGPRAFASFYAADSVQHPVVADLDLVRAGAPLLDLATPDGRVFQARLSWFEDRGGGNAVWSGRVAGAAYDTILFTLHDGHLHGAYGAPFEPKFDLRAGADGLGVVVSGAEAGGGADPLHDPWCEEHPAPLPEVPEWVLAAPDPVPPTDDGTISQTGAASSAAPPERVVQGQTAKTITLSVSPASVAENASAAVTITVTATVAAADVYTTDQTISISVGGGTVIDGVATPGADFAAVPDFTLTLAANMTTGTAMFSLDPTNDTAAEPHETVAVSGALAGANVAPAEVRITDDDQHVIDLMILYTPGTATIMQGLTQNDPTVTIQSETAGLADYVNLVWRNNALPAQVRLVHVAPVPQGVIDNRGEGSRDYIFAMRTDADLLRLRDEHDADLVYLWAWEKTTPRLQCGLAFTRTKLHTTVTMAPSGIGLFNFNLDCGIPGEPTGRSILAHEIGHNLGALHEPANHNPDPRVPIYPYAFGHTHFGSGDDDLNVATIMSYGTPRRCVNFLIGSICRPDGYAASFTREPFYSNVRLKLTRRANDDWNTNYPLGAPAVLGIAGARENERAIKHLLESTAAFSEYMLAAPPANLTGAATASGATVDVALTWDDVSSREAGYKVQYRVFGDGAWQEGAALVAGVEAATLTGLAPATRYVFRVAAPNANGLTSYSYEWAVRTSGTGPPNAPGALRAETQGPTLFPEPWDVRLTWSDWSETETGFHVQYRRVGASDWTDGPSVAANATVATVDDLLADEDYEFRVGARNSHGTAWSRVVRVRTDLPAAPDAPSDLAGVRISSVAARLSWTDNSYEDEVGETAFEIHTRPTGGQEWTIASSVAPDTESAIVAGLPEGARLDFRVASVGPGGSGFSNELSIDLAVEPPGVPVIEGWLDRDRLNDIVTRFSISVDPSNGAEVYVAAFRSGQWRRYTPGRVENDNVSPYRAEAVNGGGRRVSEQIELGIGRINPRPPPSAPSGLAAARYGPTSVRLTWTDTADDELWYRVSASLSGGPAVVYGVYPANTEEATLVGLQPGRHEFFVTLANQHYEITPRTTSFALPVPDPVPPAAASGLSASFGSAATEVDLSWTDNSSDEDGFRVGARADDGTWSFTDAAADATSATVAGLTPNTLYHFRVLADSANGSFDSNLVTFDLHPQPRAATGLTARAEGSTTAVLEWEDNARNETGYRVEARQGSGPWATVGSSLPANTTTHAVTGRAASASYGFRVVAVNGAGEAASTQAELTMPPAAPSNLQAAQAGPTSATLTWTDGSSDETGFRAEYRGSGETGWTPWAPDTAAGATGVTVSALSPNTDYEFRVLAVHGDNGLSSPSNVATVTNFPRLPEPASDLAVTFLGSHSSRVDWKDRSNDETGFMVQYRLFGREEWVDGPGVPAGAESATVTGLLANRTYRFRVLAANANGARPSYQIEKTSPPPPPDELTFTVDFPTVNKVFLRWRIEFEDFTHIKIENRIGNHPWFTLGTVGRLSFGRPRTSQSITGLTPGEDNDFRIRLINANGESSPSNIVSYTVPSGPAAPSGLAVTATGSTTVDLSWTDNSDNESAFAVEYKASADSAWTVAGSVAEDVVTAAARGLVASTAFDFRVTARNAQGSASSAAVSLTMPPPGPTGLVATATSATAADLSWTDNSSDETGFKVQWSTGSVWNNLSTTVANATTSNAGGLTSGQGYEFRVIATNANGDSTPSNVASIGPPLSPPAPTGLAATAAGSTAARLSWTDASTNETAFDVAYRTGGGSWTAASTTAADVTAATVTGLTPSVAYEFQVTARNANGSNATSAVSLTMPPAAPTGLAAAAVSASAVNLTWTDASSGETDFLVEYRRAADAAWTAWGTRPAANAVSAAVTGLAAGTVHEFRVFATHQSNGLSTPSNVATTTTFGTRPPTALSAVATDSTNLSFTWRDESTDETGFGLERRIGNGPWAEVLALGPNVEAATLGGFSASTAYGFRVSAKGPSGTSRSDPVSLTMPPPPPTGLVAAAASASSVQLNWDDASSDETSFIMEYRPANDPVWIRWKPELAAGSESLLVTNTGVAADPRYRLRAGQDYRFQVFAKHSTNGVSSPSNEAEVRMLGAPAAPSGLTATARGSTQVRLRWKDNSGADEDNFKVEYRGGAVAWTAGPVVRRDTTSANVKNLSPSRGYEFRVSAVNTHGAASTSGVTLVMPPAAPKIVGVASESASSVNVFWQDLSTDETSFVIEYRKTADRAWTLWDTEAPANARSAVVTGLDSVSYQFRVYAKHRRNGLSTVSETATLDQVGRPEAPTELTATAPRATRVALTWKDNSDDEVAFDVEQRTGDSGA